MSLYKWGTLLVLSVCPLSCAGSYALTLKQKSLEKKSNWYAIPSLKVG